MDVAGGMLHKSKEMVISFWALYSHGAVSTAMILKVDRNVETGYLNKNSKSLSSIKELQTTNVVKRCSAYATSSWHVLKK